MIATCRVRESLYGPFVPRSSTTPTSTVAAHVQQPPTGSLSPDQLSQIASYLGISGMPSSSEATAMSATPGNTTPWIFDSGATHHMTFDSSTLTQSSNVSTPSYIYTANGTPLTITQIGNITPTSDPSGRLTLPSVLCIPKLTMKLLSVGQITDLNCYVLFGPSSCLVQDHTGKKIGAGCKVNGLYQLEYLHLPPSQRSALSLSATSDVWHRRLGHPSEARLRTLFNSGVLGKFLFSLNKCETCHLSKQTATSFTSSDHVSLDCFDLVHSDIWGLAFVSSIFGYNYYVCFIDDCSSYSWIYLMRHRFELFQIYTDFTNMVHTQFHKRIKVFRSDGAKEYLSI